MLKTYANGIRKETTTAQNQILANTTFLAVGALINKDTNGPVVVKNGRATIEAGTPIIGDLSNSERLYDAYESGGSNEDEIIGVALHDVDIQEANGNMSLLYFGTINLNRLSAEVKGLYNNPVVEALKKTGIYVISE